MNLLLSLLLTTGVAMATEKKFFAVKKAYECNYGSNTYVLYATDKETVLIDNMVFMKDDYLGSFIKRTEKGLFQIKLMDGYFWMMTPRGDFKAKCKEQVI